MGCNTCNQSKEVNLVPTIDELRMILQNCGGSLRAKDMKVLIDYLEFLTDCCNGSLTSITEVIVSERDDCIFELENSDMCNSVILTENNRI